jgi:proteic killer suppression protein
VDIIFSNRKLERLCNDDRLATREWGRVQAERLERRLSDLRAAQNLGVMRHLPGQLHELEGNLSGRLAVDLAGGDRLILEPAHEPPPRKPDGGLDWDQVNAIRIVEVGDYHD